MSEIEPIEPDFVALTSKLVAAYVGRNSIKTNDLSALISEVHGAIRAMQHPAIVAFKVKSPAVNIKKSITPDYLICLECGLHFQSMKRHLAGSHGLSPSDYKEKWKLPADYPVTAPAYSQRRSALAKGFGLGRTKGQKIAGKKAGRQA